MSISAGRRPWQMILAIAALSALLAGACSSDDDSDGAEQETPEAPAELAMAPLTGLEVPEPIERPALVVKIDNAEGPSRPQAGLNEADLIVEEMVEGTISRLAAVYHSRDATAVGPVRSGRSTDVEIVSSLDRPLFAFSGANDTFLALLRQSPLIDVGVDVAPGAYERIDSRPAPSNLFTSTEALWALDADDEAHPPPPQFVYRSADDPQADVTSVRGVRFRFGTGGIEMTFERGDDTSGWARTQAGTDHVDDDGVQVAPDNVVIQFVEYVDSGVGDSGGSQIPEAVLLGEGDAWVLTADGAIVARWVRGDAVEPTRFSDESGAPVLFTPGTTWVALVPIGSDAAFIDDDQGGESAQDSTS